MVHSRQICDDQRGRWQLRVSHIFVEFHTGASVLNRMLSAKLTRIAHQVSQERDLNVGTDDSCMLRI